MQKRDLLTAQIEMFGKLLAALVLKRKQKLTDQLEQELEDLSLKQLSSQLPEIISMELPVFCSSWIDHAQKSTEDKKMLGWTLQEYSELQLLLGNEIRARQAAEKAYLLYRYLINQQEGIIFDLDLNIRYKRMEMILENKESLD